VKWRAFGDAEKFLLYVLPMKFAAGLCNRLATEAAATQVAAAMPAALVFTVKKLRWYRRFCLAGSPSPLRPPLTAKTISRQKFSPAPAIGIIICLVRRPMAQSQYGQPIFPTCAN
jgi:hypothetical protein